MQSTLQWGNAFCCYLGRFHETLPMLNDGEKCDAAALIDTQGKRRLQLTPYVLVTLRIHTNRVQPKITQEGA